MTLVVLLAAAVATTGCTATTAAPKALTEGELDALVRAELDRQWEFTGLDGVVPRPVVEVEKAGSIDGFQPEFGQCMSDAGFSGWGTGPRGLDMSTVNPDGAATTQQQQLDYYGCLARFPGVDRLSTEQLDFVYDYYTGWLVPCLGQQGHAVTDVPSREEFHDSRELMGWRWTPYSALAAPPTNETVYGRLLSICEPTIPGMEGWSVEENPFLARE